MNIDPRLMYPLRFRISKTKWTEWKAAQRGQVEIAYGIHVKHKFYLSVRIYSHCFFIGWSV